MATRNTTPATDVVRHTPEEIAVLQAVETLIESVPQSGGDGLGMIQDILNAESLDDLMREDSGSLPDLADQFNTPIRVESLTWAPSDFTGSILPFFLIVHGTITAGPDAGKTGPLFSVGAVIPVMKLLKLNAMGGLPAIVVFNKATKPTKQGYYPINMSVVSVNKNS